MRSLSVFLLAVLVALTPAGAGAQVAFYETSKTGATSVTNANETAACTLVVPAVRFSGMTVRLAGQVNDSTSASTTFTVVRIRRGVDSTGTLVGGANAVTTAASALFTIPIAGDDTPGEVASQSYTVTVANTAGAGTGKVKFCQLQAAIF